MLVLLVVVWTVGHLEPGRSWSELMAQIGIQDPERITRLIILCAVGTAVVWCVKILKSKS